MESAVTIYAAVKNGTHETEVYQSSSCPENAIEIEIETSLHNHEKLGNTDPKQDRRSYLTSQSCSNEIEMKASPETHYTPMVTHSPSHDKPRKF